MSDDLGEMVVSFAADTAGLVTGAAQAEAQLNSVEQAAVTMAAKFSSIPTYNAGESITNTDVAEAKLTLLESKVNEARAKLQTLQDAADAGQAVTGIPEATAKLVLLENEAQNVRASLQGFSGQIGQSFSSASEEIGQLGASAQETSYSFAGALGGMAERAMGLVNSIGQLYFNFQNISQMVQSWGQKLLGADASMEQTTVAFETLLGKGKATQAFLQQMKDFAAVTPFEFPQLATAAQHMIAFGFAAKEVIPTLTDIGDAMGALGKGPAEIDQVVNVFGQMRAAGHVYAQDMMQIASQGIPAWKFLADSMHKTIPEVQALSQKGLIPADTAIKALTEGMHKMFGGGMAAQADTFNGLLSTLQDNAGAAWRAFTGPLFEQAKGGLLQLGNIVSSPAFQGFAATMGTMVGGAFSQLISLGQPLIPLFQGLANGWKVWASMMDTGEIRAGVQSLSTSLQSLFTTVWPYLSGTLANISQLFQTFASYALGFAVPALQMLTQRSDGLKPVLVALFSGASQIINALGLLTSAVMPVVIAFAQWLANSGTVAVISNVLSVAISALAGTITGVITGLAAVITFFEQNRIAASLLVIPLGALVGIFIMLAVNAIASFLASVPMMVAGFLFGASAAWAMAAGVIAATWPFILLGIAVVAVIAIIVLAVQHWGDIVNWLSGVWGAFSGWFMSTMGAIGAFFTGAWNGMINWFKGAWGGIGAWFVGLWHGISSGAVGAWHGLISGIQGIITAGVNWLKGIWQGAVNVVVGRFEWMYNHNYYFKDLVDFIVKTFTNFRDNAIAIWNGIVTFFTGIWSRIATNTEQGWNTISSTISSWTNTAVNFLEGIWNNVVTWVAGIWNQIWKNTEQGWKTISGVFSSAWSTYIAGPIGALWNNFTKWVSDLWSRIWANTVQGWQTISNIFGGAWNTYIAGPLGGIWNNIVNWFNNGASMAVQWGKNLIQAFINGMNMMFGAVGQTAQNIMHNVASYLGFHSPSEKGPGRELNVWGPNLAKGFAEGIDRGAPLVEASISHLVKPLGNFSYPSSSSSSALAAASRSGTTVIQNHLYIDGREMASVMLTPMGEAMAGQIRTYGPVSGAAA